MNGMRPRGLSGGRHAREASGFITGGLGPPLWREARIGLEAAALLRDPVFRGDGVPDGRGRPVLLIPGFMAGDGSLAMMAGWLRRAGYRPSRAGMRANVDCSGAIVERLEERLERLVASRAGAPRSSARAAAARSRRCSARGAPISSAASSRSAPRRSTRSRIHPLVRLQVEAVGAARLARRAGASSSAPASRTTAVPPSGTTSPSRCRAASGFVSVYSKTDGVVDWRACLDPHAEQVEIDASHCGMAVSPASGGRWPTRCVVPARRARAAGGRPARRYPRAA